MKKPERPDKKEFKDYICRPYCVFFKEGQKEDMACGGALSVVDLIERGAISITDFPAPLGTDDTPVDNPLLFDRVCRTCPFVLSGCDFRLPAPPPDAVPCGGFVLLGLLVAAGKLDPDLLRTIDDE